MKRIFCFLFVIILCFCSVSVFAENMFPESSVINNTEDSEVSVIEETTEEIVVEEENVDNTDSQYDLLLAKIDVLISLIYCWFLWSFFCAIYKVLYRLFCFVI